MATVTAEFDTNDICIRQVQLGHMFTKTNRLHYLQSSSFGPDSWAWVEIVALFFMPTYRTFVAEVDARVVGFAAVDLGLIPREAWITIIAVDPNYRRHGLGTRLMDACEAAVPYQRVRLTVDSNNAVAQAVYMTRGYRVVQEKKGYYPSGSDGYVMEKRLASG